MIGTDAEVIALPARPSKADRPGAKAQCAPTRARAREAAPPPVAVPAERPARVPPAQVLNGLLSGASLLHSPPPALMAVWARHDAAARYFKSPALRWLRWAYSVWHTWVLTAVAYFVVWALDSPPKGLAVAAVLAAMLWLLHLPPF